MIPFSVKNDIKGLDLGAEPPLKRLWMGFPLALSRMNP